DRGERARQAGRAHHRGQLRDTQTPPRETLVGGAATLPSALHADLRFVAKPSGDLVQPHHATGHSPRNVPQREGTGSENRRVRAKLQRQCETLYVDGNRRLDLRQATETLCRYFRDSTLVHPDSRDILIQHGLARLQGTNGPQRFDLKILTKV